MLKCILKLLLASMIHSNTLNAQFVKAENKIFNTIISKQIENGLTTFYVKCSKPKTFFFKKTFLNETSLKNIPNNVLTELERASKNKIKIKPWNCGIFEENIPFLKKCIGDEKSERILQKKDRTTIFEIYKPLFDKKKIHCIIQVVVIRKKGEFSSSSFLLKKVYGKWIILEQFSFVSS